MSAKAAKGAGPQWDNRAAWLGARWEVHRTCVGRALPGTGDAGRTLMLQSGHELPGPLVCLHCLQAECPPHRAPEMSKGKALP